MTPLILASVDAFGAGGGTETGMAELAAGTGWIFTSSLYLGWGTKAQKDGIAWSAEYDPTRSHLRTRLVPELGFLRVLEVSSVFPNPSKTLRLSQPRYILQTISGVCNPPTRPFVFPWNSLSLKELLCRCSGWTRECPQKAHNRNLGEAA